MVPCLGNVLDKKMVPNVTPDEFMHRMIESYPLTHTARYWDEITPFLENISINKCVDIGCGPGLLLRDLDERFHPQKLIGIDLSPVMLDKAKQILQDAHREGRVELIQQHMQEDPSLPNKVSIILSSLVLRSFESQWTIMESIYNSLLPGGLLVLLDWNRMSIKSYLEYFKKSERFDTDDITELIRLHRNFSRYGIDDWEFILEKAGFQVQIAFNVDEAHICLVAKKLSID